MVFTVHHTTTLVTLLLSKGLFVVGIENFEPGYGKNSMI